ncbi:MAG TPA: hypothetical protein ENJ51_11935 [Leucothrix mucor]|uniref:Uncharacterized protein n=1 Tax=Leucothrix mucor TaxID=45248 RepID=A0A7V2T1M4_LEUMU|nr:hypothetical protein [Leucothrix mucor]
MYCFNVKVSSLCFGTDDSGIEPIHFSSDVEILTVRELIERSVTEQIKLLQKSQIFSEQQIKASLERQYLSDADIASLSKQGHICLADIEKNQQSSVIDIKHEIARAEKAFTQKQFFISLNNYQPEMLEEKIRLTDHTEVLFLRLMPLVGG